MRRVTFAVLLALAGCSQPNTNAPQADAAYTGRLRIDAGTTYVALEEPSPIGGACAGWNAVEITGGSSPGMKDVVCWRREGDQITLNDAGGSRRQSGPATIWNN